MPDFTLAQALTVAGLVIAYATLVGMWRRDRRNISDKAEAAAKIAGEQKARLNGVIEDVDAIKKIELPAIAALTNQNAQAIAGLTAITAAQSSNIDRALEMTGERTKLLDRALEKLVEDK